MAREMKNSGIEWIGDIPCEWETDRLQWHLEEMKVQNIPVQSEQVLSLTIEAGVIPYEDKGNQGNKAKENYEEYKLAYPDTLVVNSMNVIIGAVGISKYFGCVSPVYYVFKTTKDTELRYIYYLFTNVGFQKEMRNYAKGILEIRLRISSADMLRRIIPKPPYEEQMRIADFLDRTCAEIDTVIEKTKATIEDYKKYKSAVIDEAIKNENCSKYKFRYLGELKNGLNYHNTTENRKVKFLGVGDFKDYTILSGENCFSDLPIDEDIPEEYLLKSGDIVFVRSNGSKDLVGRSVMVADVDFDLTYSGFCIRFRNQRVDLVENKYLLYFFRSEYFKELLKLGSVGANINNLSQDILNAVRIPIPTKQRQQEIINYLDRTCAEIDKLIADKTHLLEELESYKKSVIYEYVTGKKEVVL